MITFLFTDIEGSTRLWETMPAAMAVALARHEALLREAIASEGGTVFKTIGDAFCATFPDVSSALDAANRGQMVLAAEVWPDGLLLRVRMAIHVGDAEARDRDYFGSTVNRVARLLGIAHGGQVLLSDAARLGLAQRALRDMGSHRLRDLGIERVWQVGDSDFPPLRSLRPENTNLPAQSTSFLGRDREMADLRLLLDSSRLVTLVGPGGTGKTRLALQLAAEQVDDSDDGVWLVELARLDASAADSSERVLRAVAETLAVRETPGQSWEATLVDALKSRRLLLALDNCEHVLDAVARLVDALIRHCPDVTVLATSREAMGIAGERIYPVAPLPDDTARSLFVARALQARPDFDASGANASILRLVRRLDGIPLAIELAAARIRALTVEQIEGRLDDRFRLLTGGSRAALPRQQTLRALIDWSYELLGERDRCLLHRLAIFVGGWSLDAAEAACEGDPIESFDIVDALTSLVEKSLVVHESGSEGVGRYRFLETVRVYAAERWRESDDSVAAVRDRHARHFLEMAGQAGAGLNGPNPRVWLDRLDIDYENLVAALDYLCEAGDGARGLDAVAGLTRYWENRGHLSEGRLWIGRLLDCAPDAAVSSRADALRALGGICWRQGDYPSARKALEESRALWQSLGNLAGQSSAAGSLANVLHYQGDRDAAERLYEEALELARSAGQPMRIAIALNNLGLARSARGAHTDAIACFEEGLVLRRQLGDQTGISILLGNMATSRQSLGETAEAMRLLTETLSIQQNQNDRLGIGYTRESLGRLALGAGDLVTARRQLLESLSIRREMGERWGVAVGISALAELAAAERRHTIAAQMWGLSQALCESIGALPSESEAVDDVRRQKPTRDTLGEDEFAVRFAAGREIGVDDALGRYWSESESDETSEFEETHETGTLNANPTNTDRS